MLQDEVNYLKLREKKIMYLVHLLQQKGYPVTQIFESQIKQVPTLRFDEFLTQKEQEQAREDELNRCVDISFHPDDSYVDLVSQRQMRPVKPACIPVLDFTGLPDYVTSEDEEQSATPSGQQQATYDESVKYISDYYH